jgi:ribose transport system permease protein
MTGEDDVAVQDGAAEGTGHLPRVRPSTFSTRKAAWVRLLQRYGVILAFLVMVAVFGAMKTDTFMTIANWRSMVQLAAPLMVLSFGITVVLAAGDFDLSIGGTLSLGSALGVLLMSDSGLPWALACLVAMLGGVLIGSMNGLLTAYIGAPAFIATLAAGQALSGLQLLITDNRTIFEGMPQGFLSLTSGMRVVVIAAVVGVVLAVFMAKTPGGRYIYAIGVNATAARFAGLRVRWWRLISFAVVGACAATAGLMIASQSAAHQPDVGTPYLLPAYAAVFLGAAVGHPGRFTIAGTAFGVLFLQVLATGLATLTLPGSAILIIQGLVLTAAIILNQVGGRPQR